MGVSRILGESFYHNTKSPSTLLQIWRLHSSIPSVGSSMGCATSSLGFTWLYISVLSLGGWRLQWLSVSAKRLGFNQGWQCLLRWMQAVKTRFRMKQKSTVALDPPRRQAASNMMTRRGAYRGPRTVRLRDFCDLSIASLVCIAEFQ